MSHDKYDLTGELSPNNTLRIGNYVRLPEGTELWNFEGMPIDINNTPEDAFGFCYNVQNNCQDSENYLVEYIGKKNLYSLQVPKGCKKAVKRHSDWPNYFGSQDDLKRDVRRYGPEHFIRTILCFCKSKRELTYTETMLQFKADVLTEILEDGRYKYYNLSIMGRYFKGNLG